MNSECNEVNLEPTATEDETSLCDQLSSEKIPVFQVNRDIISSIALENQPDELKTLGLVVYDQSRFEEEILKQVDDALQEQEHLKQVKNAAKLQSNSKKKVAPVDKFAKREETEKEKLVRLGHMTPFGTVLKSGEQLAPGLSSFEKYLLEQEQFNNKRAAHKVIPNSNKGKSLKISQKNQALKDPGPTLNRKQKSKSDVKKHPLEKHCLPRTESDSEYLPSDEEVKESTPGKKKRKRKSEDWATDDSDWEYSDEEEDIPRTARKKRPGRLTDDGRTSDFKDRLALWLNGAGKEELEYELFEGGYRLPKTIWNQLYNYQKVGVRWMWELHLQRCGGILGDEMGLGKTIQVIAFLAGLAQSQLISRQSSCRGLGPVLLIAPATVMHQWVKEFHKWWPPLRVAILHDSGSFDGQRNSLIKSINNSKGVLITSYAGLVNQKKALLAADWDYVVLDEGHKIRNPDAQATLVVKQFRTCHRLILSGSPVQNNLKELWSLFDFIFPGKLGTLPVFLQQFSVPITQGGYANASQTQVATAYKCATVLRDTIDPYLLRRNKDDVKTHLQLPPKNEQVLFCRLTQEQRVMYQSYLDSKEIKSIIDGRLQIFVGLTNLRKICNHPDLFQVEPTYGDDITAMEDPKKQFGYVERSGKMIVVESLLRIWKEQHHRVLLFSQSRKMLDVLETFVKQQDYKYLRLDGNTSIASRQPMIERFNTNSDIFMFLLTTRVGGLGVNLTGANRVLIYDPDWNPSTDVQARERAWRIGQKKDVTVYRLLTSGTIEEKIYHRQIFKQYLTNRVLKDPKQRRFFKSNDLYELFTLKDTDNQCTETEAIFAGTGSEVATNHSADSSKKGDKPTDEEWMDQWKKDRQRREIEWRKSLDKEKRKKEIAELKETKEQRRERKKKEAEEKRRQREVKVDGAKVDNVLKMSTFRHDERAQSPKSQDDYVLQRLFAKTGVLSALRHDTIVGEGNPDYALVETEAERVAKEAVKELKNSRRNCWNAETGVPSWTGQSGVVRTTQSNEKPRFGSKKKPTLVSSAANCSTQNTQTSIESKKTETLPGPTAGFSSQDLLTRMKTRNRLLGLPTVTQLQSTNEEEHLILNSSTPLEFATDVDYKSMLDDIRNFVAFRGLTPGQVTTTDILAEFNGKLPAGGVPLFRALLKQICTFSRDVHEKGIWQLNSEFR